MTDSHRANGGWRRTGQVPPEIMRSKERASGMPLGRSGLPELTDSSIDFSDSAYEMVEVTYAGRR